MITYSLPTLARRGRGTVPTGSIVRAKAPLRVSFAGGGTDLPHWYAEHPGAVFSGTIDRHAHVTLYPRDDEMIRIRSIDLGVDITFNANEIPTYDGVLDLAKAVIYRLGARRGMDLDVRSSAPPGSGLGGSSAVTAAIIGVVAAYTGQALDRYEQAELNFEVERHDLGIVGGKQDQYATTFGGFNVIEFHPDAAIVNGLELGRDIVNDLESHLLLCYTGRVRTDLGLVSNQVRLYREGQRATHLGMMRLCELAYEMAEAVTGGRLNEFGRLLHESYLQKRQINPDVATGTIADALYAEARRHGALGGKLLGAGGGGYLLIYCETGRQQDVRLALQLMGGTVTDFAFDDRGVQVWRSQDR
jgi:D-glycero-alpha-D-manno-heptose-7-phosphate kinase